MRTMLCSTLLAASTALAAIAGAGTRRPAFAATDCAGCHCGSGYEKLCFVIETLVCRSWTFQYGDLICTSFTREREYVFMDEHGQLRTLTPGDSSVDAAT